MRARFGRALLVVALLLAQQSALAHSVWHLGIAGQPGVAAQSQDSSDSSPRSERLCDLHTALGTVLGALSSYAAAAQFEAQVQRRFIAADSPSFVVPAPLPASRGPPLLP